MSAKLEQKVGRLLPTRPANNIATVLVSFLARLTELDCLQQVESWDLVAGGTEGTSARQRVLGSSV